MALGLGVVLGCSGSAAFLCETDASCQQAGVSGLCQATGYCSFPDGECPSGQRYGAHVESSLAQTCVEPELLTDDTNTSNDHAGTSTTSTPTTGLDGPATTDPIDDTGAGTSTHGMADDPGTTSAGPPTCWSDDFEDGMIGGEWCLSLEAGILADEPLGHLRFIFLPERWGMGSSLAYATLCEPFPLLGAEAATEVVAVPQISPSTEAFMELGNDDLRLGLGILDDELYAFTWNGTGYAGESYQLYDAAAHHWLRISGTEEGLVAETSPDGMTWAHVYTVPTELAAVDGTAALGAWSQVVPLDLDEASFERFERCTGG